jgi:hypothetical protein
MQLMCDGAQLFAHLGYIVERDKLVGGNIEYRIHGVPRM